MTRVTEGDIDPEIVKALEAILLVAVEPVTVKLLAQVLELKLEQVQLELEQELLLAAVSAQQRVLEFAQQA